MLLLILCCLSIFFSDGVIRCLFLSLLFFILIYFSFIFCSSLYISLWRSYMIFASLIFLSISIYFAFALFFSFSISFHSLSLCISVSSISVSNTLFLLWCTVFLFVTLLLFTFSASIHNLSSISWSILIFSLLSTLFVSLLPISLSIFLPYLITSFTYIWFVVNFFNATRSFATLLCRAEVNKLNSSFGGGRIAKCTRWGEGWYTFSMC